MIMKHLPKLLILSMLGAHCASAAPPPKPNMSNYRDLLINSPFGQKKPEVVETPQVVAPTTTYILAGVSATAEGWLVGIKDKKNPNERITLRSDGEPVNGISIVEVKQDRRNYRNTEVIIKQGVTKFSISFDTAAVEKSIQQSVKESERVVHNTQSQQQPPNPSTSNQNDNNEQRQAREEMMREAAELRKMRESGNTGEEYEKRRQALMEKANEMRRDYRGRRRGGDENGRDNNDGGDRAR